MAFLTTAGAYGTAMPKKLEKSLAGRASQKGLKGKRWRAYVWGTMNRLKKKGKVK